MSVILTERAASEVQKAMTDWNTEPETALRVAVLGGGCSGFEYSLTFVKDFDAANDVASDQHGVKVIVDRKSAMLLEGTTLDFHEGLDKRGFTFNNPNAVKSCGCGKSFSA